MLFDDPARRAELNRWPRGQTAEDRFQPIDALEPPVAEKLGVVRRGDATEIAALLVKLAQLLLDQMGIMVGVRPDLIGGALRIVRLLAAKIDARAGYPPVLHAGFGVFAMKLAVDEVPGVPERRRPDLLPGPLVPGQNGDLSRGIADPVGDGATFPAPVAGLAPAG